MVEKISDLRYNKKAGAEFLLTLHMKEGYIIMDIKAKINELTDKIKGDKNLLKKFQDNPVAALEGLIGVDLPDDQVEKIADGIKAKIQLDNIGDALGSLFGKK